MSNISGMHSIPAMHTTHKHIELFNWRDDESLRTAWRYVTAQDKPNYPVPAIRDNNFDHLHPSQRGGLRGCWRYFEPYYIDWSRGQLEWY